MALMPAGTGMQMIRFGIASTYQTPTRKEMNREQLTMKNK